LNDEVTTIDISKKFIKTRSNNRIRIWLFDNSVGETRQEEIEQDLCNGGFNLYDAGQIQNSEKKIVALRNGSIAICITNII